VARKERLDKLLVERGLVATRARGRVLIMAGEVLVDGELVDRPGTNISGDAEISLKKPMAYVSRGGFKLEGALSDFEINVSGLVCADVGASTGGFTDVLLQKGARLVYAIDVGYGQLDWKLRQDERVIIHERTNVRYLDTLERPVDLVCIDVSFISLKLVLPVIQKWLTAGGSIIALIKPQFEAGPKEVGKGGVIRDPAVHRRVLMELLGWARDNGLAPMALTRSAIEGASGNVEFLVWLRPNGNGTLDIPAAVSRVVQETP